MKACVSYEMGQMGSALSNVQGGGTEDKLFQLKYIATKATKLLITICFNLPLYLAHISLQRFAMSPSVRPKGDPHEPISGVRRCHTI